MKRILLIVFVLVAAVAVSCKKEPKVDAVTIKTAGQIVPVGGGVLSIAINSTAAWTAKVSESWVTLSPTSGEAGNATVKASVLKNDTNDNRTATVTFTAGATTATYLIVQSQFDALNLATTEFTVEAAGGTVQVPVSSNVDYTIIVPDAVDWLHVTSTRGMVDTKVTLTVDGTHESVRDETTEEFLADAIVRTATIKIVAEGLEKAVTVRQKAFVPHFGFESDYSSLQHGGRLTVPQEGGTFTIDVVSNLSWRAHYDEELPPEDASWLEFQQQENALVITVKPNEGFVARDNWIYVNAAEGWYGDLFGGYFQVYQKPAPAPATPYLVWNVSVPEGITPGYNRLAYSQSGALLVSDGEKVHAINPANGRYWKAISWPGITPTSIDVDDAGHVIVASNVEADMDGDTAALISGTELKVYYFTDENETPKEISLPNGLYGTLGGFRARGDLATKGAITGVAGNASYWFGYDIANFEAVANYYGTQSSGPGPGPDYFWTPETAAAVSVGPDLHDGVLFRANDGGQSVYYRKDAYTPKRAADMEGVEYEPWTLVTNLGAGDNENQNNMDIIDFNGRKIIAFTQGYHFTWPGFNADIYVVDVTDPKQPQVLATVKTEDWILGELPNGEIGADVLLREGDGAVELYVIHSGMGTLAKFVFRP